MINEKYLSILDNPIEMRKLITDFADWLSLGSKEDLECTLKVYEAHEMYEDCAIIKNKLNQ